MAVTYDSFVTEFEEFNQLGQPVVEAKIGEAQRSFDVELLGACYDDAVKYKTAILLMSMPGGRPMALTKDKATPYESSLQNILNGVPARGLLLCP
jgi:hypothetical protein